MMTDVISVAMAIIVLAGLSMAVLNGGKTAQVIGAATGGFAQLINTATHPGTSA